MAGVGFDLAEVDEQAGLAEILDLLLHHLAVADHGRERRPELVAHIGQEGALRPVGGFGRVLGGREFELGELAVGDVVVLPDPFAQRAALVD